MAASTKLGLITRSMCSAASGPMVKAPIQVFGLEGRYATALFSAATKKNQLENVEKDLVGIQQALQSNVNLREAMVSPIINRKVMGTALREASKQLHMSETTSHLLDTLAENGRMKRLNNIINSFKTIMAAHRGDVVCEVVTAKPLESGQQKQLEGALKQFVKANENIKLTSRVDPSIIGGMIVSIGDKYVDMSIASKIKMYTEVISAAA